VHLGLKSLVQLVTTSTSTVTTPAAVAPAAVAPAVAAVVAVLAPTIARHPEARRNIATVVVAFGSAFFGSFALGNSHHNKHNGDNRQCQTNKLQSSHVYALFSKVRLILF
jgi:hypothetical protein